MEYKGEKWDNGKNTIKLNKFFKKAQNKCHCFKKKPSPNEALKILLCSCKMSFNSSYFDVLLI